jgi:hypothetical protein
VANEITISATLRYAKAKASASLATSFTATQVGDKYEAGVQQIGTVEEAVVQGDIGTIGYMAVRNMDATNYVEFAAVTAQYTVKLMPGEGAVVPWKRNALLAKANTAAVEIEYLLIEA